MKHKYKLCHINQTDQNTIWKGTCIEFKKYADCRFWANIYEIYWNLHSARISLFEKKKNKKKKTVVEIISMAIADSLDVICFDLYQLNIFAEST